MRSHLSLSFLDFSPPCGSIHFSLTQRISPVLKDRLTGNNFKSCLFQIHLCFRNLELCVLE